MYMKERETVCFCWIRWNKEERRRDLNQYVITSTAVCHLGLSWMRGHMQASVRQWLAAFARNLLIVGGALFSSPLLSLKTRCNQCSEIYVARNAWFMVYLIKQQLKTGVDERTVTFCVTIQTLVVTRWCILLGQCFHCATNVPNLLLMCKRCKCRIVILVQLWSDQHADYTSGHQEHVSSDSRNKN